MQDSVHQAAGDSSRALRAASKETPCLVADAAPERDAAGVPRGEWGGLSPKQAWWAGYRVGKGLPPDMPRREAVAADPCWYPECGVPTERMTPEALTRIEVALEAAVLWSAGSEAKSRIERVLAEVRDHRAASAPQAVRKPLTKEKLFTLLMGCTSHPPARLPDGYVAFARAIEAAHGIVTPAAAPTAEREAFERWAKTYDTKERGWWLRLLSDGGYSCQRADDAWAAWQARAALSAPVAAQPAASGVRAEPQEVALLCAELCAKSLPTPEHDAPRHWDAYREAWGMRQRVTEEIIRRIAERFHFDPAPYIGTSLDAAMRTHLSTALTGAAKD